MGKLVRFGIAMDEELLARFDRYIRRKGYRNRSEALRDLVRHALVQEAWQQEAGEVVATITLVYDHEARRLPERLTDLQHHALPSVVSALHVHLDEHHCLEVVVARGNPRRIERLAHALLTPKGVLHGGVVATGVPVRKR